jgi:hydroxymethylbilane synthase
VTSLPSSERYPIALDVRERTVVVVGGGEAARRSVRGLLAAGAAPTVVAPRAEPELRTLLAAAGSRLVERDFEAADVAGAFLVFAASDDPALNASVVQAARAHNVPVNDANEPARGNFQTPLVHRNGKLTFTIDAGELADSFGPRLSAELHERFDERYARAAETLERVASYTNATLEPSLRSEVMQVLAGRPIDELARLDPGRAQDEADALAQRLASPAAVASADFVPAVCATRASALAMWQTRHVMALLAGAGIVSTVLQIATRGDLTQDRSLAALGSDGVFVKELELALRERRADYAVHSCKDLPSALSGDMELAAIGAREDPRDAFCSEIYPSFDDLPAGAVIGTSSPRRRAQLGALRPDLRYETIRGNVDTRLRKLREGQYDAIVLAVAGLKRLGLGAKHVEPFEPSVVVPAVAQGALAVETRAGDPLAARIRSAFNDPASDLCVRAERAFLRALHGGCQAPVGAYATLSEGALRLRAIIAAVDGSRVIRRDVTSEIQDLAELEAWAGELGAEMLAQGGAALLASVAPQGLDGRIFLLARTQERPSRIAPALRGAGAEVVEASSSDDAELALGGRTPHVLLFPSSGSIRAIADYLARLRAREVKPLVATMGAASSAAASAAGFPPDIAAPGESIAEFVHSVTRHIIGRNGT